MSRFIIQQVGSQLKEFIIEEEDFMGINTSDHLKMLELVFLIRCFELTLLDLKDRGVVYGPVHSSIGQEAVAAGCGIALDRGDIIGSTHRAHHHFLGKALPLYYPHEYDPAFDEFSPQMQHVIFRTLAEIMGLKFGWCGGRGGSMHLRNPKAGIIGTSAIVGGGIALTTGAVWAQRLRGTDNIGVAFFGDGAMNQGILLESANMAKLWNIPVIFAIENNLYAVGTSIEESSSTKYLAQRALGFDIEGIVVDGMDPAAVYTVLRDLRKKQESGCVPFFVEFRTYRFYHHKGKIIGSSLGYRTEDEEIEWQNRDPFKRFPEKLKALHLLSDIEDSFIKQKVEDSLEAAVSRLTEKREGKVFIPDNHWPARGSLHIGLVGLSDKEFEGVEFSEITDFSDFVSITFVNVISQVATRNMEKDNKIIVLGEEVGKFGAGAYGATRFVIKRFPERTYNTPISEAGFVGIAFGAALCGMKPIVEIMFPDFVLVAADQLFNQIGKLRYLYGGTDQIPLIVRTRIATGLGFGAQHSSDPCGLFAIFPGWRIIAPSNPFDYIGLFNSAMISGNPVLIMEHHALYKEKGPVPRDNMDYSIRLGKARVFKEGQDVTVITYLNGVKMIERISDELEQMGISIEAIDLRSIDYSSIDYETISHSLRKTGKVIILEEISKSMGIGARVADELQERFFSYLKVPVHHISSLDIPFPVSRKLEQEILINSDKIKNAIKKYVEES